MIYLVSFLGVYFVFSIPSLYRYFQQAARIHKAEESVHQANKEINQLKESLSRAQTEQKEKPLPVPQTAAILPDQEFERLKEKYRKSLLELERMSNRLSELEHKSIHELRVDSELGLNTLHFPTFRQNQVYYAPLSGKFFHAVHWCYNLDKANDISSFTYYEAIRRNYKPCPRCVQLEQLPKLV